KPADRHWSPDILLLHRYLPHRSVHPLKHKVDPSIRKARSVHDTAESPDRAYARQNVKRKNKAGQVWLPVVHRTDSSRAARPEHACFDRESQQYADSALDL